MKVKTSVTLSPELLAAINRVAGNASRSAFIEMAVRRCIAEVESDERNRRDGEILARLALEVNADSANDDPFADIATLGDEFSEDDFVAPEG